MAIIVPKPRIVGSFTLNNPDGDKVYSDLEQGYNNPPIQSGIIA